MKNGFNKIEHLMFAHVNDRTCFQYYNKNNNNRLPGCWFVYIHSCANNWPLTSLLFKALHKFQNALFFTSLINTSIAILKLRIHVYTSQRVVDFLNNNKKIDQTHTNNICINHLVWCWSHITSIIHRLYI